MIVKLTSDYARQHMARAVPGAFWEGAPTKSWIADVRTPHEAAVVLRLFPELSREYPNLVDMRDELLEAARPFDNATNAGLCVSRDGAAESVGTMLNREDKWWYDFQDLDLGYVAQQLETLGGAYIGWERGLGKTLGACSLIDSLCYTDGRGTDNEREGVPATVSGAASRAPQADPPQADGKAVGAAPGQEAGSVHTVRRELPPCGDGVSPSRSRGKDPEYLRVSEPSLPGDKARGRVGEMRSDLRELSCSRTRPRKLRGRVLIVAPNTAKESVWAAEIRRFLPDAPLYVLPNTKVKREKMLERVRTAGPCILVIHYEALAIIAGKQTHDKDGLKLRTPKIGKGWDKYGQWDLVVADEAHRLSNTKAQMVKALKKVPSAKRLALSGSIVMNHAEELFSPLQWLFPKAYKAKWRDWNDRFLDYVEGYGHSKLCVGVKPDRVDAMRRELGVFMVFRRKSDELDLPPKTEQTLLVDLSAGQRKAYDELLNSYFTVLEDGTAIKAADSLALLTRLRQVATGLDTLGKTVADSSKLELAEDMILDSPDEAFVVFSWYKAPCHTLAARLEAKGVEVHVVTGDTKHEDRADAIARFQAGAGRVFIGTLATLGESVNLQRASNALFLDRHWNPATNTQAADRIYRIGQARPVTVTHLVARDTVDELRVLPTLASKEALRRAIFGGE